jgi:uncharacterized protein
LTSCSSATKVFTLQEDISQIPALDQHAHNVRRPDRTLPFEAAFTEATDPLSWQQDAPHGVFYRRSLKQLASLLECAPEAKAVKEARLNFSLVDLTAKYLQASNLKGLLLDDGLAPEDIHPWIWHDQFVPTKRLLRIEYLAEDLMARHKSFGPFEEAYRETLKTSGPEVLGFKCIAAYRGGLAVRYASRPEAKESYPLKEGRIKRSNLYSYLIQTALEVAHERGLPVQFHTGFGDPDLALEESNPLYLRPLIERFKCPFVLLHAGYPYVRETGFLASVYSNVWVDFGLALPFLSHRGMRQCLSGLLELSPLNKILYSSDASLIPDLYYLGAVNSRRVLSEVLSESVSDGDLTSSEALEAARWILAENAEGLYRWE